MELNVVTGNPSRESMYPNGRFSRLPEHSSHTCCPLFTPECLPFTRYYFIKHSKLSAFILLVEIFLASNLKY